MRYSSIATLLPMFLSYPIVSGLADRGKDFGNVIVENQCNETVWVESDGVYGNVTQPQPIAPSGHYAEPYQETCVGTGPECFPRINGSGVSIKIISNISSSLNHTTQFEYSLAQNSNNSYTKLTYDISLLDCGDDFKYSNSTEAYPKQRDCPAFAQVVLMTTQNTTKCPPVYCTGSEFCSTAFNYLPSPGKEPDYFCDSDYHGDLHVVLCSGNRTV